MFTQEAEELLKSFLPYYVLIFLPVFIIVSPAMGYHEFPVYRMQHYDLHGVAHGCRSASLNLEARSLTSWGTSRHCVITRLKDLTIDHFHNIRKKAGALVIVLPEDLSLLNNDERQHLLYLESSMMVQEIHIPVYFINSSPELDYIVTNIERNLPGVDDKSISAVEALFNSIAANGYQFVVIPSTVNERKNIKIATIQGHLSGINHGGPTIGIVAHYDSFGIAPELSFGADSNGSGVIILLELVRLFSNLYSNPKTHGKYNIVFLLSGGGKINYQGSKKWLEDQLDAVDSSIINEAKFIVCLDTLANSENSLFMHVSKPPRDGTPASDFFKKLKLNIELYNNNNNTSDTNKITVEGVHKKINLAEDILAWEHERFSIRRLPAFTLSTLKSHRDLNRATILDKKSNLNVDLLLRNTKIVAEALASHIYNVSGNIFGGTLDVNRDFIEFWLNYLTDQPRSTQLLAMKDNSLVYHLKDVFQKYLRESKISYVQPDKRDPDFQFYDNTKGTMNIYNVKPAIFDLLLTIIIALYLGSFYLIVQNFSIIYNAACKLTKAKKN